MAGTQRQPRPSRPSAGENDENPFVSPDSLSDVRLVVEGKALHAHKVILAKASPVFKAMFFPETGAGFREKDAEEVPLPAKKYGDVVAFLTQLYAEYNHQPVTDDTLAVLTGLSDEYDVTFLLRKCEKYIVSQLKASSKLSVKQVLMYLVICERYEHRFEKDHFTVLLPLVIKWPLRDLERCPLYSQLGSVSKSKVVYQRCQSLESDYTRMKKQIEQFRSTVSSFVSSIEYDLMNTDGRVSCCGREPENMSWSGTNHHTTCCKCITRITNENFWGLRKLSANPS